MFWGLEMEPAKVYKQKVEKSFHISMACLQPNKCNDQNYTSLILRKDGSDFVLCNLHKDKAIQVQLDLMFGSGDEIAFTLTGGKNQVYLTGYIIDEDQMYGESDSEGSGKELEDMSDEEIPQLVETKRKLPPTASESKNKKAKLKVEPSDEDDDDDDEEDDDEEDDDEEEEMDDDDVKQISEEESGSESDDEFESDDDEEVPAKFNTLKSKTPDKQKNKSPNDKQQQQKKKMFNEKQQQKTPSTPVPQLNGKPQKNKKGQDTPVAAANTPKGQKTPKTPGGTVAPSPQKTKLEGGVIAMDMKVGTGAPAKPGKKVTVYYTGRLQQSNKVFDASTQGKGFVFQLGRGEVIKGWDIGVAGMKIGGKRKITVPASLAYGNKGSPPVIPPNANLVFDIELRSVN